MLCVELRVLGIGGGLFALGVCFVLAVLVCIGSKNAEPRGLWPSLATGNQPLPMLMSLSI